MRKKIDNKGFVKFQYFEETTRSKIKRGILTDRLADLGIRNIYDTFRSLWFSKDPQKAFNYAYDICDYSACEYSDFLDCFCVKM